MLRFILLIIALTLSFDHNSVHAQKSCKSQTGVCVPMSACKTVKQLQRIDSTPPPISISEYVRQSDCGTFNNVQYVCCDAKSVDRGGASVQQPEISSYDTNHSQPMKAEVSISTEQTLSILTEQQKIIIASNTHTSPPLTNSKESSSTELLQTVLPSTHQHQHPPPSIKEEEFSKADASSVVTEAQIQFGMNILEKTKCGQDIIPGCRISNGVDANLSEYPWMALLVYFEAKTLKRRTLGCGGTLITDRYVLTAAHCIRVRSKKLVSVRLGEHDTEQIIDCINDKNCKRCAPAIQEIDIEKAIYHKDYNPSKLANDIGLLRLIRPAVFLSNVLPVCLPITPSSLNASLDNMKISGWGKKENGLPATVLQVGTVSLRENSYCENSLKLKLTEYHLCAGGGDEKIDTCKGDSGGPTFSLVQHGKEKRYVQYGVISLGAFDCGLEFPSVFTRVQMYLNWIAGNLRS